MNTKNQNTILQSLKIITLAIFLSLGLSYVYAWTAPTTQPPDGNTAAPLNTSLTSQYKGGALGVGGLLEVDSLIHGYSDAIFDGSVKVGQTTATCNASQGGALRYNNTEKCVEYCDETTWACFTQTPPPVTCYPQIYGGGFATAYTTSYLADNSGSNGASQAALSCGETGPSSPAPDKLNIRFYMHNTSGCLVGFNSPIEVSVPFSGYSEMWKCGSATTYLESVTCTETDCVIIGTVNVDGVGVYQQYQSIVPRPAGL